MSLPVVTLHSEKKTITPLNICYN